MTPKLPFIVIFNNQYVDIIDEKSITNLYKGHAKEINQEQEGIWYANDGNTYKFTKTNKNFNNSIFNRLLSSITNKKFDTEPEWSRKDNYELSQLKKIIIECINKDDDILTQFVPAEYFIKKIETAKSLNEIKDLIYKYSYKVEDEEAIWQELKQNGIE